MIPRTPEDKNKTAAKNASRFFGSKKNLNFIQLDHSTTLPVPFPVRHHAVTPDKKYLIYTSHGGHAEIYNLMANQLTKRIHIPSRLFEEAEIYELTLSANGERFALSIRDPDNLIKVYETATGKLINNVMWNNPGKDAEFIEKFTTPTIRS